jgi:hypothetical protein
LIPLMHAKSESRRQSNPKNEREESGAERTLKGLVGSRSTTARKESDERVSFSAEGGDRGHLIALLIRVKGKSELEARTSEVRSLSA